jgi:hypothetical protein
VSTSIGRRVLVAVSIGLSTASLVACGSTARSGDPSGVVAQVGHVPITRTVVGHWISALAGGDYFELSGGHAAPAGLVSDPPNYKRCVTVLQSAKSGAPARSQRPTGAQLLRKCQQLYQALKTQAIAFLVDAQWAIASSRELGITATDAETRQVFEGTRRKLYGNDAALRRYLASRHLTLSDLLLQTRLNLLAQRTLQRLHSTGDRRAISAQFNETWARWTRRTSCNGGEIVEHCRQYRGGPTYPFSPPASVMIEQVAGLLARR